MPNAADDDRITAWAVAAGRGDRSALASFILATQRDVHRFVRQLADPGDADDVAQETYLRALRALPGFAGRSTARTWLLAIARNTAADAVRSAVRRPRTHGVDDWEALPPTTARRGLVHPAVDEAILLHTLVDALDTDRREAFVLTQMLDLSYAEAAEVCGCPIGTIRSRVARAREDLVTALASPTDRRRGRAGLG